jgi:hypothetical protein
VYDENDTTTCIVVNGNRLEADILCREDLEEWQTRKNVKIWYIEFAEICLLISGTHYPNHRKMDRGVTALVELTLLV